MPVLLQHGLQFARHTVQLLSKWSEMRACHSPRSCPHAYDQAIALIDHDTIDDITQAPSFH